MKLLDIFSFKKESSKIFTKENIQAILDLAKKEIIKQAKEKFPGKEKMEKVENAVILKIRELRDTTKNSAVRWLLDLLIMAVPTITQYIYETLKETIKNL